MSQLTPAQIVSELDRFIVGQQRAKRAVHVAGASSKVHDCVEVLALERGQAGEAVAVDPDESHAIGDGTGETAGSTCDLMARVACTAGDGAAEEHRAAQDQHPHAVSCAARRSLAAGLLVSGIWQPKRNFVMDSS